MTHITASELLQPRYKVIAAFPGNDEYPVGMIKQNIGESYCQYLDQYPAIFKRLRWFDHRNASELPKYVKTNAENLQKVSFQVEFWQDIKVVGGYEHAAWWQGWPYKASLLLPISKEEYENANR